MHSKPQAKTFAQMKKQYKRAALSGSGCGN